MTSYSKEKKILEKKLSNLDYIQNSLNDHKEIFELAFEENDTESLEIIFQEISTLQDFASKASLEAMMSGECDSFDCFLEIHAGAGGTDSNDWAQMLNRMYLRWCEIRNFQTECISIMEGEEAGIKSVTYKISGEFAYGWAKIESGIHRLVRLSPFNSNNKRHTSFASVHVYPLTNDDIEIDIQPSDLRIDTFRASGAGGQHVNKTDSAIRILHIPTNIMVSCQNSRSQHRNRADAMNMLKAKLYEIELQKKQLAQDEQNSSKLDNSWGNQIRSYVLHPYSLVKDLRSNHEEFNTQAVLDGNIDNLIFSVLKQNSDSKKL